MHQTLIQFPEIQLRQRDGHKVRGYFAHLFRERSTLLHNHFADGRQIYRYPLVQYKVIGGVPTLVGIEEGARLLIELFMEIRELEISGRRIPILSKNIRTDEWPVGVNGTLYEYTFISPWIALNQKNYKRFICSEASAQKAMLNNNVCSHILSFMKGIGYYEEKRILSSAKLRAVPVQLKNQPMKGFVGTFRTNVRLPEYIGLGKSVSRGFGTLRLSR